MNMWYSPHVPVDVHSLSKKHVQVIGGYVRPFRIRHYHIIHGIEVLPTQVLYQESKPLGPGSEVVLQ